MKRVGILGGTFDPPHLGHLIIAEQVHSSLKLNEVWFMPSYEPPHKSKAKTSQQNRIAMVERAIKGNDAFKINLIEMERLGRSYTYDTMKLLNDIYPDITFYFIIGADMVEYLPHWHRIDELVNMLHFVGVKRPEHKLETNYPIIEVDVPLVGISSTDIRERLRERKSVKYLIPESVEDFIKGKRLYEQK